MFSTATEIGSIKFHMPALLLAASYNADSKLLRRTASNLGWETLRLGDDSDATVPEDFKSADGEIALYFAGPPRLKDSRPTKAGTVGL